MVTRLLSKDDYLATFLSSRRDVTQSATNVIDIWPYVAAVPGAELWGHTLVPNMIQSVYRCDDRFDHVLALTETENVFLVVIVDLAADRVHGHYLLDISEEYGTRTAH